MIQFVAISVTSLIIFFVLVHHPNYSVMASLLSDISHSVLLVLSSVAILIGFIKTSNLKFQPGTLVALVVVFFFFLYVNSLMCLFLFLLFFCFCLLSTLILKAFETTPMLACVTYSWELLPLVCTHILYSVWSRVLCSFTILNTYLCWSPTFSPLYRYSLPPLHIFQDLI